MWLAQKLGAPEQVDGAWRYTIFKNAETTSRLYTIRSRRIGKVSRQPKYEDECIFTLYYGKKATRDLSKYPLEDRRSQPWNSSENLKHISVHSAQILTNIMSSISHLILALEHLLKEC